MIDVLLVIFGAGASYDSVPHLLPYKRPTFSSQNNFSLPPSVPKPGPHEQDRPPLANQLFDDRESFLNVLDDFEACNALIPRLRSPAVSVERELAAFQDEATRYPARESQLAAVRYYLHTALWRCQASWKARHHGTTNYGTFVDEIEKWHLESREPVCFVTFNYDTMLEEAMRSVLGTSYLDLDAYISRQDYTVIKPHGSINWGREIDMGPIDLFRNPSMYSPQRLVQERRQLNISNRYTVVDTYPMLRKDEHFVFPAIAIPVENKDDFECPSTHVDRLTSLIPSVNKIITVGWRGVEATFLGLLATGLQPNRAVPLMIVSGSQADAEATHANLARRLDQVANLGFILPPMFVEDGFSGLILRGHEKLNQFLRMRIV